MNTKNKEILGELQNEINKSEDLAQQLDKTKQINVEAKQIIEGYVIQDEMTSKEIQSIKEHIAMYKAQLASTVQEKDNVNKELEDTWVTLQWEKARRSELEDKILTLQEKMSQTKVSDQKSDVASPHSFEEFVAMRREIKLLKLEIMSMKESTEHKGRGKTSVRVDISAKDSQHTRRLLKKSSSSGGV